MTILPIKSKEVPLLRRLLPLICITVPWEIYQYNIGWTAGWGIKFSLFYLNFDMTYGTIVVSVLKQLTMLSSGGVAASIRTISWAAASLLCVVIVAYELLRDKVEYDVSTRMTGMGLLVCGTLLAVSSFAVWNEAFKAIPVGFGFFAVCGYLLIKMEDLS
ncbi:MAG: hypothetical protein JXA98_01285 [Methanosarcinaceae archaeon]|nr:hypothetical protein [Methanosarcinaceae archaeon]